MFDKRLKELRKSHALTQAQLADMLGVSQTTVAKYEKENPVMPGDDIKIKLAGIFGVSIDYLLGNTDVPFPVSIKMTAEEAHLVNIYRGLNAEGKRLVADYAKLIGATNLYREDASTASVI